MRRRLLVLGGTGFVGTAVLDELRRSLHRYEVMVLGHRNVQYLDLECFDLRMGSLTRFDLRLLDHFRPHAVLHLARISGRGPLRRTMAAYRGQRANARIIRHLRAMPRPPRVIYLSGTLAYGDHAVRLVTEDTPLSPTGFARQYIRAELPWMRELARSQLPVTILRPPWILGRGSWFASFFLGIMQWERVVPIYGSGKQWMSLLDLQDCAGLVLHALERGEAGSTYNLFSPEAIVQQETLARSLAARSGLPIVEKTSRGVHDEALWEALTFSLRVGTKHTQFSGSYRRAYPTLDAILDHHLQQTLARTPP